MVISRRAESGPNELARFNLSSGFSGQIKGCSLGRWA